MASTASIFPTLFLSHGGGPLPLLGDPSHEKLVAHFRKIKSRLPRDPSCIVVVSAHWEEDDVIKVSTATRPKMIYDYYGFSKESYSYKYNAIGSPTIARKVIELLKSAGIEVQEDPERGFDHGVFVPLMVAFPEANIPVVSLSLNSNLDPKLHLKIGESLFPLRKDVLFIGSGMSYHNMRGFSRDNTPSSRGAAFSNYLVEACGKAYDERTRDLVNWEAAPGARESHPREEHLIPLLVMAGAGGQDPGSPIFDDTMLGVRVLSFMFGDGVCFDAKGNI